MDDQRFDELTKVVGAASTRRQALKRVGGVLAGAIAGAVGLGRPDAEAAPGGSQCANQGGNCTAQKCCRGLECITDGTSSTNKFCCPGGTKSCNGICLNVTSDVNNCGSCGKVCPGSADPCKVAACINGQCTFADVLGNPPCEDGNPCTVGDTCQNGTCRSGSPKTCPASSDPCKVNVCDPITGNCVAQNAPNATPCEDGNLCTVGDTCQNGTCQAGSLTPGCIPCNSTANCPPNPNPCKENVCQNRTCVTQNKSNGTSCNFCFECVSGICTSCTQTQKVCCPAGTRKAGLCFPPQSAVCT